jgi:hypothetical protein
MVDEVFAAGTPTEDLGRTYQWLEVLRRRSAPAAAGDAAAGSPPGWCIAATGGERRLFFTVPADESLAEQVVSWAERHRVPAAPRPCTSAEVALHSQTPHPPAP